MHVFNFRFARRLYYMKFAYLSAVAQHNKTLAGLGPEIIEI